MKDIFADLYNKVLKFFNKADEQRENAKDVACNRLKLVLMQDRTNLSPAIMDRMRRELIELLSKYMELDKELLDLNFEHEDEQMALMLSIPVVRAKTEEEIQAILDKEDEEKSSLDNNEKEVDDQDDSENEENSDVDESSDEEKSKEDEISEEEDDDDDESVNEEKAVNEKIKTANQKDSSPKTDEPSTTKAKKEKFFKKKEKEAVDDDDDE